MPEQIEDREQLYALIHEFDDRTKAMHSILENAIRTKKITIGIHEEYLLQSYLDYLKFIEAKYEQIDQWLSMNDQNREL